MRIKHTLWKVSNGWLLLPDKDADGIGPGDAPYMVIFKTLKEFSEWKPKQKRNRKPKTAKETPDASK